MRPLGRSATPRAASDGTGLLAAVTAAVARLEAHVDEVDALNVFPVPDGDTGTNMLATMRAALAEAAAIPAGKHTLESVASALSHGALMGARGNSGVILSQLISGMAGPSRGSPVVTGAVLARALRRGADAARSAIAQPVEGTVLTVARDAAVAATKRATEGADMAAVLEAAVDAARASVTRSPELLPVLREAGVVDAGGHALAVMLAGALSSLRGPDASPDDDWIEARPRLTALTTRAQTEFGFETTFVLRSRDAPLSAVDVRRHLEGIAESVVVAGDDGTLRIHVHAGVPDEVVAYGRSIGIVEGVAIEDLDRQARDMCDAVADTLPSQDAEASTGRATALGLVAMAPGRGIARVLRAAGAAVVEPRDHLAAAGELVAAIRATTAEQVLLLIDDASASVAQEAARLVAGVEVTVVPTRDAAQAVAAALAMDPDATASQNAERMLEAARRLHTARVPGGSDPVGVALEVVAAFPPGYELMTVYVGDGVEPAEAEELGRRLREAHPDVEVEVVDGGQRHDRYLIAAE